MHCFCWFCSAYANVHLPSSMSWSKQNWVVQDQLVLALKTETERQLELAPSEAVPRTALYVGSGDQMIPRTDGTVIQGGQDRPVRKSSFRVYKPHGTFLCKPQGMFLWPSMASGMTISGGFMPPARRMFLTFPKADTSDLKLLFDAIGPTHVSYFIFLFPNWFQFKVCLVQFDKSKFLIVFP